MHVFINYQKENLYNNSKTNGYIWMKNIALESKKQTGGRY